MARTKRKQSRTHAPVTPPPVRLYTVDVSLLAGPVTEEFASQNPEIVRTIQIRGDHTLEDLHWAIYDAFDREEEHLYEFQFGRRPNDRKALRYVMPISDDDWYGAFADGSSAGTVGATKLDDLALRVNRTFFYWFDFGDSWWHRIKVVGVDKQAPAGKFPNVIRRVGASPP